MTTSSAQQPSGLKLRRPVLRISVALRISVVLRVSGRVELGCCRPCDGLSILGHKLWQNHPNFRLFDLV